MNTDFFELIDVNQVPEEATRDEELEMAYSSLNLYETMTLCPLCQEPVRKSEVGHQGCLDAERADMEDYLSDLNLPEDL